MAEPMHMMGGGDDDESFDSRTGGGRDNSLDDVLSEAQKSQAAVDSALARASRGNGLGSSSYQHSVSYRNITPSGTAAAVGDDDEEIEIQVDESVLDVSVANTSMMNGQEDDDGRADATFMSEEADEMIAMPLALSNSYSTPQNTSRASAAEMNSAALDALALACTPSDNNDDSDMRESALSPLSAGVALTRSATNDSAAAASTVLMSNGDGNGNNANGNGMNGGSYNMKKDMMENTTPATSPSNHEDAVAVDASKRGVNAAAAGNNGEWKGVPGRKKYCLCAALVLVVIAVVLGGLAASGVIGGKNNDGGTTAAAEAGAGQAVDVAGDGDGDDTGVVVVVVVSTPAPTDAPVTFVPPPTTLEPATELPTLAPTGEPLSPAPTGEPVSTDPTASPTDVPSGQPVTTRPTAVDETPEPTAAPATSGPTTAAPITPAPITLGPTTAAPTTPAPITSAPVPTEAPVGAAIPTTPSPVPETDTTDLASTPLGTLLTTPDAATGLSLSTPQSLQDPDSPQYAALKWMVEEDEYFADAGGGIQTAAQSDDAAIVEEIKARYAAAAVGMSLNVNNALLGGTRRTRAARGLRDGLAKNGEPGGKRGGNRELQQVVYQASVQGWFTGVPMCEWEGLVCSSSSGNSTTATSSSAVPSDTARKVVSEIRLPRKGLNGQIPPQIGHFAPSLTYLDFAENEIGGEIPAALYGCSELTELYLDNNDLEGGLTSDVSGWSKMHALYLGNNRLSGTLPKKLNRLKGSMRFFSIHHNQFSGAFPLLNLRVLFYLDASYNQFTGLLPLDLKSRYNNLQIVYLDHNQFVGPIPQDYANIGGDKLYELHLNNNKLCGGFPQGFAELYDYNKFLFSVTIYNNSLTTTLDEGTCGMSVLADNGELIEMGTDCSICQCQSNDKNGGAALCGPQDRCYEGYAFNAAAAEAECANYQAEVDQYYADLAAEEAVEGEEATGAGGGDKDDKNKEEKGGKRRRD